MNIKISGFTIEDFQKAAVILSDAVKREPECFEAKNKDFVSCSNDHVITFVVNAGNEKDAILYLFDFIKSLHNSEGDVYETLSKLNEQGGIINLTNT